MVLGIFALTTQGLQGGVIQMVNHGLTTGALFLLVGMIYERRHTRAIADYGGLATVMPVFAGMFLFISLASIGLPPLNGFVGEFLVLLGSYLSLPGFAVAASLGVVLAAVYLLWAYQRMFTGPITVEANRGLRDLGFREVALLVPIVALVLFLGIFPKPALDRVEPAVQGILDRIEATTDYEVPAVRRRGRLAGGGGAAVNVSLTFLSVAPEIALAAAVVLLLMVEVTFKPRAAVWGAIAGAGLAAGTALSAWQWVAHRGADAGVFWHEMIAVDGFSALAGMLVFPLAGLGLMSAWRLAASQRRRGAEFVALVMLAATGAHLMAASADLIMLFIGLEVFSHQPLRARRLHPGAGATPTRPRSSTSCSGPSPRRCSCTGWPWSSPPPGRTSIYGPDGIADYLGGTIIFRPGVLLAGLALLLVGMAFKVSAAPFHVWAPDVYQGAPGGITGFLAASAKVAGFAALARVLTAALGARADDWVPAVAVLAAVSVVVGTLLAIAQDDVKRLLAYSSVAHAGFILTALVAGRGGIGDMWFYLATYAAPGAGGLHRGRGGVGRRRRALARWRTGPAWAAAPRGWRRP